MIEVHPMNRVLLSILENQVTRTAAAFEGLSEADLEAAPGGDCHSIRQIASHLVGLRQFQLKLMGSALAGELAGLEAGATLTGMLDRLAIGAALVRRAIEEHDADDWYAVPAAARPGPWGEEATISRLVRPLNDFTNHLGAIRAIRRIRGNPAVRTQ